MYKSVALPHNSLTHTHIHRYGELENRFTWWVLVGKVAFARSLIIFPFEQRGASLGRCFAV